MPVVRLVSWNIFNFSAGLSGVLSRSDSTERMLEVVHPKAGPPACDIFVIIEPVTKKQKVGDPAVGGGPTGGTAILGMLQTRPNGGPAWDMVAPLCIYSSTKGETVLVFYRTWLAPINSGVLSTNAAGTPTWSIMGTRESCPFRVRFSDTNSPLQFELIAQHAPSPTYGSLNNRKANVGVAAVGTHAAVTGNLNVVYLGDLNICGVAFPTIAPHCTMNDAQGHQQDRQTLLNLGKAPSSMTPVVSGERSSLKKTAATVANYREHAYDNILAKGHTAVANAQVIDLVQPLIATYQANHGGHAVPNNVFRSNAIFHLVRLASQRGISDHLPVKVDLTF